MASCKLHLLVLVVLAFATLLQLSSPTEAKGKSKTRTRRRRSCPKSCVNKFNAYQKGEQGERGPPGPQGPRGTSFPLPICQQGEYLTSDGIRLKCVKFDLTSACSALKEKCAVSDGTAVTTDVVEGKMIKFMSKNVIQHMNMNAWDVETFSIDDYLFVGLSQMKTSLEIYKWGGSGSRSKFYDYSSVKCPTARNWAPFKINNVQYIVVASFEPRQPCPVYRWTGHRFVNITALKCSKAFDVSTFSINGAQHVAFTNFDSDVIVYKWTGKTFTQLQKIDVVGMYLEFYSVGSDTHLVISGNPFVYVYRWRKDTGKFVLIQKIVFEQNTRPYQVSGVAVDNKYLLAIATIQVLRPPQDKRTNSNIAVYQWVNGKYQPFQNISSRKARRVATISSPLMGRHIAYLAVVNYDGNPEIFAMEKGVDGGFKLLQDLQGIDESDTERARDISFFQMNKDIYLILTTSNKFLVYRGAVV